GPRRPGMSPSSPNLRVVRLRTTPRYVRVPVRHKALSGISVCHVTTTDAPARRLIEGLAACIRTRGYADTTVADIVREARTSRRTFYEHFADRQECLVALLYESNQRTIARISE